MNLFIRDETSNDSQAISKVTRAAFETMELSDQTEHFIVEALRRANALSVSLVAETERGVIGHIAFSPVTISDDAQGWYGLGPVSVHPAYQRRGIGKILVRNGLSRIERLGAKGCCLIGHPEYYRQFGFENVEGLVYEGVPPEVFFALSFNSEFPQGKVSFHDAFKATG